MTQEQIQAEITALKELLTDTDYVMLKPFELMLECTTATQMVNVCKATLTERGEIITKRQEWRQRINDLEAMLAPETTSAPSTENVSTTATDTDTTDTLVDTVAESDPIEPENVG